MKVMFWRSVDMLPECIANEITSLVMYSPSVYWRSIYNRIYVWVMVPKKK